MTVCEEGVKHQILAGYLTREDLAKALHRSVRTIDRWAVSRIGPPKVKIGRLILYRIDAVRNWLDSLEEGFGRRGLNLSKRRRVHTLSNLKSKVRVDD